MKVYFLKTDISQYVIYPVPAEESLYFVLDVGSDEELAQKTPVLHQGKLVLVDKQPTPAHEWDGKAWMIPPEKQTALFAEQKESLIAQLANKTDALKAGLLVGYSQTEIDSFYRQEKEALAWQADHNAETPMLKQIALLRGVSFEILVQKVIEKSEMFAMVIGAIIGQRQQLEDRILTATKPEELETIKNEVEAWQLPNLS